ncbi:type VI secretion system-associated FHA domain protein TagH [Marinimicrobium agarilyticum]|uniref:type VI secretion system-associated FHA domain protein TagH n=1 Tax=Marinimicrobium agarilyticum TaxID=306546 RepID=UPI000481D36D|nr:type VI secretion system-associated FHA domain protein TagH [Marinimicrobium agarilyticum]
MTLHLRITKAPDGTSPSQTVHAIDEAGGTLGRGPDNTLMLPDPERILSSRHCEFVHQGGHYQIVDWSTNGTFLNSSSEPLGKGTSAALNHGDVIEVGDYCFTVELATPMDTGTQNTPFASPGSPFATVEEPLPSAASAIPDDPFQSDPFGAMPEPAPVNGHDSLDPLQLLDGVNAPPAGGDMPASAWEAPISDDLGFSGRAQGPGPFAEPPGPDDRSLAPQDPGAEALAWPESKPENLIPDDWMEADDWLEDQPAAQAPVPPVSPVDPEPPRSESSLESREPEPPFEPEEAVAPEPPPVRIPRPGAQTAKTAPPPRESASDSDALFSAMGIDVQRLSDEERAELLPLIGKMMREVVDGMMQVLRSRASIKNEFRMNVTTIQPVENNPLKFSADVDEALDNIFLRRSQAYKEPLSAVREGFQEIAEHQLAMIAGMRSAFEQMLRDFDHERLESRFDQQGKRSAVAMVRRARYWEQYQDYYRELSDNIERSFQQIFGDEFVQAYQDQLRRLSSLRSS